MTNILLAWITGMFMGIGISLYHRKQEEWLQEIQCENMNCRASHRTFAKQALDGDDDIICPSCQQASARIV